MNFLKLLNGAGYYTSHGSKQLHEFLDFMVHKDISLVIELEQRIYWLVAASWGGSANWKGLHVLIIYILRVLILLWDEMATLYQKAKQYAIIIIPIKLTSFFNISLMLNNCIDVHDDGWSPWSISYRCLRLTHSFWSLCISLSWSRSSQRWFRFSLQRSFALSLYESR